MLFDVIVLSDKQIDLSNVSIAMERSYVHADFLFINNGHSSEAALLWSSLLR